MVGYKAYVISTIVDPVRYIMQDGGYKAYVISTIVDRFIKSLTSMAAIKLM